MVKNLQGGSGIIQRPSTELLTIRRLDFKNDVSQKKGVFGSISHIRGEGYKKYFFLDIIAMLHKILQNINILILTLNNTGAYIVHLNHRFYVNNANALLS